MGESRSKARKLECFVCKKINNFWSVSTFFEERKVERRDQTRKYVSASGSASEWENDHAWLKPHLWMWIWLLKKVVLWSSSNWLCLLFDGITSFFAATQSFEWINKKKLCKKWCSRFWSFNQSKRQQFFGDFTGEFCSLYSSTVTSKKLQFPAETVWIRIS